MITFSPSDGELDLVAVLKSAPSRVIPSLSQLDKLHGGDKQQRAAHQHRGSDGSFGTPRPATQVCQRVHQLDGFLIGGVA